MLDRPESFEPLTDEPWRDARVRTAIRDLVADVDRALRGPKLLRQPHDSLRCHTEEDMRRADEALNAMSPPADSGTRRTGVEIYEVVLDESFG